MNRTAVLLILGALCLSAGCGGPDTPEKLAADYRKAVGKLRRILETVRDEPSAWTASEKIEKLAGKFESLKQRRIALGGLGDEEKRRVKEKFLEKGSAEMAAIILNMRRIEKEPRLWHTMQGALETLGRSVDVFD